MPYETTIAPGVLAIFQCVLIATLVDVAQNSYNISLNIIRHNTASEDHPFVLLIIT